MYYSHWTHSLSQKDAKTMPDVYETFEDIESDSSWRIREMHEKLCPSRIPEYYGPIRGSGYRCPNCWKTIGCTVYPGLALMKKVPYVFDEHDCSLPVTFWGKVSRHFTGR